MSTERNYSTMTEEQAKNSVRLMVGGINHLVKISPVKDRVVVVKYVGILSPNTDQWEMQVVVCDKCEDGNIEYGNVRQTLHTAYTWKEVLQFLEVYETAVKSLFV